MADAQPPPDGDQGVGQDTRQGKKKRAYAGQAYEFGAGANSGAAGQGQPPAPYQGGQPQPQYGGFSPQPQQQGYQQPAYGQPGYPEPGKPAEQQPGYGQQPPAGQTGYPAPDQGYSSPAGVGGVAQQFGQMNIGAQQPQPQQQQTPAHIQLNRLQTTDLISQPFNVAEIDSAPPSIILPPNVRLVA